MGEMGVGAGGVTAGREKDVGRAAAIAFGYLFQLSKAKELLLHQYWICIEDQNPFLFHLNCGHLRCQAPSQHCRSTPRGRRYRDPLSAWHRSQRLQSLARAWVYDHFLKDGALKQTGNPDNCSRRFSWDFPKLNPASIHRSAVCVGATYGEVPISADPKVTPKSLR